MMFWFIAAAMVAIALAFLLPPLFRRPRVSGPVRSTVNVDLYRERLAELETERGNGSLTDTEYTQARAEIEQAMLQDVAGSDDRAAPAATAPRAVIAAIAIFVPVFAGSLYWKLGALEQVLHPAAPPAHAQPDMHSIEQMVNTLAAKLATDPKNAEGWGMLGRSYVVLGRYGEAVLAFSKARDLTGDTPDLLADQAEAMALANNNALSGEPEALVKRALKDKPDHPKALWLAGHAAIQQGRTAEGIGYWQRLIARMPADSAGRQKVEQLIAQVKGQAGLAAAAPAPKTEHPALKASITVRVALAPELKNKVSATDTVFVFARAAEGPKMPLAIVKKQVKDLPITVTLDDAMAMMPQMRLSNFPQVVVGARVSKSGAATPTSGDIEGYSATVPSNIKQTVVVVMSRSVP